MAHQKSCGQFSRGASWGQIPLSKDLLCFWVNSEAANSPRRFGIIYSPPKLQILKNISKMTNWHHCCCLKLMTYTLRPERQDCSLRLLPDCCPRTCTDQLETLLLTATPSSGCLRSYQHLRCWIASCPETELREPSVIPTICLSRQRRLHPVSLSTLKRLHSYV